MTKEQEEAIEWLNTFKNMKVLYGNTFAMTLGQLKPLQGDIETVLNMLKENSEEIEQKNTELAEKSAEIEKLKVENKKLNKRLDEINKTNYPIIN